MRNPFARLASLLNQSPSVQMPYEVDCDGLTGVKLQPGDFERELRERRDWCKNNAIGEYDVEPIGPDPERLTARRFKFANQRDAALFKLFFPTVL
jgi:hypothetical protein